MSASLFGFCMGLAFLAGGVLGIVAMSRCCMSSMGEDKEEQ